MKIRFAELDCLRGIAALFVVFFHVFYLSVPAFQIGITGVDLFFIISGFVIYLSINNIKYASDFVISRLSRLYPTYWVCVTITFTLMIINDFLLGNKIHLLTYLANMSMFQYYLGKPDLDGPYWTMIIEMLFYIFILIVFKLKLINRLNFIGLIINLFIIINFCFRAIGRPYMIFDFFPLFNFFPLFFAGIIFYQMYINKGKVFLNSLMLLSCFVTQITSYKLTKAFGHITYIEYTEMLTFYFSLFFLFVFNKLRFLISNIFLFLGKISFSLYLIHQYFIYSIVLPLFFNFFHLSYYLSGLIGILLSILLASIIQKYCEAPFSKKMKVFLTNNLTNIKAN